MAYCSIILPVYNGEKYIEETLNTIKKQIGLHDEVIVINDGSTDHTLDILNRNVFPQLQIINKENGGVSSARNIGIEKAKNDYIVFMDSDDLLCDGILHYIHHTNFKDCDFIIGKTMIHLMDETNEEKVIKNLHKFKLSTKEETISDFISSKDNLGIWAVWRHIFRREFLIQENLRFSSLYTYAEDMDFIMQALLKAKSFGIMEKPIVKYRIYSQSVSGTYSLKSMKSQISVLYKWQKYFYESQFELFNRNRIVTFLANKQVAILAHTKHLEKNEQEEFYEFFRKHSNYLRKSTGKFKFVYRASKILGMKQVCSVLGKKNG